MSDQQKTPRDVLELIDEAVEGRLPPERLAELTAALKHNKAHVAHLVDQTLLHAQLHALASAERSLQECLAVVNQERSDIGGQPSEIGDRTPGPTEPGAPTLREKDRRRPAAQPPPQRRSSQWKSLSYWRRHRWRFYAMALAATLLVWAAFFGWVLPWNLWDARPNVAGGDSVELPLVAQVTGLDQPVWEEGAKEWGLGVRLRSGRQILLKSGLVELTFDDGARTVLEGPCQFTLDTSGAGTLAEGKLAAYVSKRAVGFAVVTPTVTITDLGTRFGVSVVDHGGGDVHVFAGAVTVKTPQQIAAGSEGALLRKDESVRIVVNRGQPELLAISSTENALIPSTFSSLLRFADEQEAIVVNGSFDLPIVENYRAPLVPYGWIAGGGNDGGLHAGGVRRHESQTRLQCFFDDEPSGSLRQTTKLVVPDGGGATFELRYMVTASNSGKCAIEGRLLLDGISVATKQTVLDPDLSAPMGFEEVVLNYQAKPEDAGKSIGIEFAFDTLDPVIQLKLDEVRLERVVEQQP